MKIFFLLSIIIIAIAFLGRKVFFSAKRNLFKDQAAWSGKDIKIKYNNTIEVTESNDNENFLKLIADESKIYLENESKEDE
tara:strand:- start:802 stop:1044 length:243 start_codon:yes stop_codon:yes gene_type:complete